MKFHLIIFLAAALLHRISAQCDGECSADFKGKLVCGFLDGCHLDMEWCAMLAHNCARLLQRKHLFMIINAGKCSKNLAPMCETVDF